MWQKLQTDSQLAFQLYLIDRYDSEENCITISIGIGSFVLGIESIGKSACGISRPLSDSSIKMYMHTCMCRVCK